MDQDSQGHQDQLEMLDHKDPREVSDHREGLDLLGHQDLQEIKVKTNISIKIILLADSLTVSAKILNA